jgi:NifU-like protein involved in Fe-S cluster formation
VKEARFKSFGCTAAIAAGSMITTMIRGRSVAEAALITNADVARALGGLPDSKLHCSVLAEQAIREALRLYRDSRTTRAKEMSCR